MGRISFYYVEGDRIGRYGPDWELPGRVSCITATEYSWGHIAVGFADGALQLLQLQRQDDGEGPRIVAHPHWSLACGDAYSGLTSLAAANKIFIVAGDQDGQVQVIQHTGTWHSYALPALDAKITSVATVLDRLGNLRWLVTAKGSEAEGLYELGPVGLDLVNDEPFDLVQEAGPGTAVIVGGRQLALMGFLPSGALTLMAVTEMRRQARAAAYLQGFILIGHVDCTVSCWQTGQGELGLDLVHMKTLGSPRPGVQITAIVSTGSGFVVAHEGGAEFWPARALHEEDVTPTVLKDINGEHITCGTVVMHPFIASVSADDDMDLSAQAWAPAGGAAAAAAAAPAPLPATAVEAGTGDEEFNTDVPDWVPGGAFITPAAAEAPGATDAAPAVPDAPAPAGAATARATTSVLPGWLAGLQQRGLTPEQATFEVIDEHSVAVKLGESFSADNTLINGTTYKIDMDDDEDDARHYSEYLRGLLRAVLGQVVAAHEVLGHGFGWTAGGVFRTAGFVTNLADLRWLKPGELRLCALHGVCDTWTDKPDTEEQADFKAVGEWLRDCIVTKNKFSKPLQQLADELCTGANVLDKLSG